MRENAAMFSLPHNAGRILTKSEIIGEITVNYVYTYDSMGRLETVRKNNVLVEEYGYNSNGSRIYEMNSQRGITGRNFVYSDEDHLLTAGDVNYQYDADGFLITKTKGSDVTTYDYSLRGELLGVTLPDGRNIEYIHDPLGRRIAKKINGVITEKYLWQGLTRLLAIYDGSDNLLMRFEYADARMPVSMTRSGVTYFLAYDQVGSLKLVIDAAGNVIKNIEYDTFGNILNDSNPAFTVPFGFAGGLHDRDTGLVRFGYRDYDPDTGRWTAKDPIGFSGGDTDLFGYCLNDPINSFDPLGMKAGDLYNTPEDAALAAINDIMPKSLPNDEYPRGREWGGWIYESATSPGRYSYTEPRTDNLSDGVCPGKKPENGIGPYHSHGGGGVGAEEPSPGDGQWLIDHGDGASKGYLGVPTRKKNEIIIYLPQLESKGTPPYRRKQF